MPNAATEFYSRVAPEFHASYQGDPNRLERLRVWHDFLDRYSRDAAFAYDLGCGSGILACELARRGIETVGIDGAPGMLAIAQQTAQDNHLSKLSFRQLSIPVADVSGFRKADLVIASSVIEYLDSVSDALRFARELLNEGGVIILSVSNRDSLSRRTVRLIHRLTGKPAYMKWLLHFMTVDSLRAQLEAAGFSCLESSYFGRADRLNRLLARFLPPRMASNMIIMAARKN